VFFFWSLKENSRNNLLARARRTRPSSNMDQNHKPMARLIIVGLTFFHVDAQSFYVPASVPVGASKPVGEAFVSLSFEFGSFPSYAVNKTTPNQLTGNLLDNIARYQGTRPYVRVGGVTQ
jgi:hypothetical protein